MVYRSVSTSIFEKSFDSVTIISVIFILRFQAFEQTLQEITSLFDAWDRTTGTVTVTTSTSEGEPEPVPTMPGPKSKAQPGHKKGEKEKDKLKDVST